MAKVTLLVLIFLLNCQPDCQGCIDANLPDSGPEDTTIENHP